VPKADIEQLKSELSNHVAAMWGIINSVPSERGDEELFKAFEAGFVLGRQNSPLPGSYGTRLRSAFNNWKR
jgi:hypothetical protein